MLLKIITRRLIWILVCLSMVGCDEHRLERNFFRQPPETRLIRFRQYPLEDQYKIFRYGNDVVEPPALGLASPIAERGVQVVPFLLSHLNSEKDDAAVRDIVFVFSVMAASKSYDVKSDSALMNRLGTAVSGMRDKSWQDSCVVLLKRIKESSS